MVAQAPRYVMLSARGATMRSTLDLLALPLPFTQTRLLDAADFAAEAWRRRVRVDPGQLEVLHRARLLVPFFEVSLGRDDASRAVDFTGSMAPHIGTSTYIRELYRAAAGGRAADPRCCPFRPWPKSRTRTLWPQRMRGYLYSWHQLFAIRWLNPVLEAMRMDRVTRTWALPEGARPAAPDVCTADSWRGLAVTLAAIDARYWPLITHTVHFNAEVWRDYNQAFDADAILTWTGLGLAEIADAADRLRHLAAGIDVLGAFYDVVRRANPEAWTTMRGEALLAMDYRVASEALDALADDLGRPAPSEEELRATPPAAQRLGARPRSTDAALTDLGVSPHPSLVVGVEGATEDLILPRVFETLGIPLDRDWIRIEEFGGADRDLSLLAKYAAEPLLGRDHGRFVDLDRPVTRFLVLVDAEKKYKTREQRAKQRRILLDKICARLPRDLRPDLYGRDAHIVEIRTWGRFPFEFAHLTDKQLAVATQAAATTPHPIGTAALVTQLHAQRGGTDPNIEKVWGTARWPGSNLSKIRVADAYWPVLKGRIERAVASGSDGPPIMRAALRAWELASMPNRRSMALRRH